MFVVAALGSLLFRTRKAATTVSRLDKHPVVKSDNFIVILTRRKLLYQLWGRALESKAHTARVYEQPALED